MLILRKWHSYIGLFTAPSVLFFALTGALQVFGLHEAHGDYRPAVLIEKLSKVHKDQVFEQPHRRTPAPGGPAAAQPDDEDERTPAATYLLKLFFLLVALGLAASASLGIWIGLTQSRRKGIAWTLLIAGCVIPVLLLAIAP